MTDNYTNGNGYPTDAALERIRAWSADDLLGWFAFIKSCWWAADWGCTEFQGSEGHVVLLSTGGWSGNEEIIAAMKAHGGPDTMDRLVYGLWARTWYSTRRGGHYEFRFQTTIHAAEK